MLETLDDFYNDFGLEARITEFDLPGNVPQEVSRKLFTRRPLAAGAARP